MDLISYAQNAEDIMLWRALKDVEKGFYIDVGAYAPEEHSVTKFFYDRGWRGINVEPNKSLLEELIKSRQNDINLSCVISDVNGSVGYNQIAFEDGNSQTGLSTLSDEFNEKAKDLGFKSHALQVESSTLERCWETHVPKDQEVHFLKIDVEGAEDLVIRGANFDRHRPWIIVAEAVEPLCTVENHHKWEPLLLAAGYSFAWFDGLNRFYVANEHKVRAQHFNAPANVFDGFRYTAEVTASHRANAAELALDQIRHDHERLKKEFAEKQTEYLNLIDECKTELAWLRQPFWVKSFFRSQGNPRPFFQWLLFHTSGRPRKLFRRLIMDQCGARRALFQASDEQATNVKV